MFDQKNKNETEAPSDLNTEESSFTFEPAQVEIGSGYTLQISRDQNEHPVVDIKTYGKIDMQKVRRDIERNFPNAHIRQMGQSAVITVVKASKKKPKTRKK